MRSTDAMHRFVRRRLPGLLLACALAACGEKKAPAPAGTAPPAGAASTNRAMLDCDGRGIVLEATCSAANGPGWLACTAQSLAFVERASGAVKSVRRFAPQRRNDGGAGVVTEMVGGIACVASPAGERYVIADMFNGGNCEECEWHDAYDWDGKLVASDRDRNKPSALLNDILPIADRNTARLIGRKELDGFYRAPVR